MVNRRPRRWLAPLGLVLFVAYAYGSQVGAALVRQPQSSPDAALSGFDQFVGRVMEEWRVPGLAIGIVRNGTTLLARGYGYRNVEQKLPVTPQTLMAIGSNSKSFTVTLLGMLSDEGRLDWDKPVREYLPDFALQDDVATRLMTPTDLVDHRSGLPRHDALWYGRGFTRKDLYLRLRYLEPSASFRQRYQYNNLMLMTAGVLVEQITGQTWDAQIRQRIFTPLGMTRSNTSVRDLPAAGDCATPYVERGGTVGAVALRNIDAIAPAGAINSSVDEMLRYIGMHIEQGAYDGRTLVSKRFAIRMQSLHSASPLSTDPGAPVYPELGPGGYGLGVGVASYRGRKLVSHGGGIDGFVSAMSWMPDEKTGVIVLSNLSGRNPVPTLVMREAYDRVLGLQAVDWAGRARADQARAEAQQQAREKARDAERVTGTAPSHPLADYGGTFEHPGYGIVKVAHEGGRLTIALDDMTAALVHFHYDVFRTVRDPASPNRLDLPRVTFALGPAGTIESVALPLEPAVSPIVFRRKPARSTSASGAPEGHR